MSSKLVGGLTLPPVSQEFINELEKAFPPAVVQPGMDRDKAMYEAGSAYVVDWIKQKAAIKAATTTAPSSGATVRMGS